MKQTWKLSDKNIIYVVSFRGQLTASNAARLLAIQSAQSGRNVVLCDTTGQSEKDIKEENKLENTTIPIHIINDKMSLMTEALGGSFFTAKTFNETIKDLAPI